MAPCSPSGLWGYDPTSDQDCRAATCSPALLGRKRVPGSDTSVGIFNYMKDFEIELFCINVKHPLPIKAQCLHSLHPGSLTHRSSCLGMSFCLRTCSCPRNASYEPFSNKQITNEKCDQSLNTFLSEVTKPSLISSQVIKKICQTNLPSCEFLRIESTLPKSPDDMALWIFFGSSGLTGWNYIKLDYMWKTKPQEALFLCISIRWPAGGSITPLELNQRRRPSTREHYTVYGNITLET